MKSRFIVPVVKDIRDSDVPRPIIWGVGIPLLVLFVVLAVVDWRIIPGFIVVALAGGLIVEYVEWLMRNHAGERRR